MKLSKVLIFLVTWSIAISPAAAETTPRLAMTEVAEGVFVFQPTPKALAAWRAVSNSGAVVLDDGVLIYDVHWTPEIADEARRLLRAHTDKPVRYVVASHFHGDHTGGFWAYEEVERITHHANRERLVEEAAKLPQELPQQIAQMEQAVEGLPSGPQRSRMENALGYSKELLERIDGGHAAPLPTLTFESKVVLHRGRPVEIYFLGRGHTAGDAIVFLPEEKVAFLGDLLFNRTLPNVNDGFTRDWIVTLEKVLKLGAERFVSGHGAVGGRSEVLAQIAYLKWLRGAVEPFVREGKTVEEAQEAIELPEAYADFEFAFFLPQNVAKVYGELSDGL